MASQQTNNTNSRTIETNAIVRSYPSQLHQILALTPHEVEADIRARGKTPQQVLGEIDAIVLALRAKTPGQALAKMDRVILDLSEDQGRTCRECDDILVVEDGLESLRFYEESVAAGIPMGDGGDVPYRKARGSDFFGHQDWNSMFVAKVSGWSMREDHITDGDVVLVDTSARPKDGDIVLAYIVGEGQVVKRLRLIDGERMILESANPDFKPIVIDDSARVAIRGVVKGRAGKI